MHGVYLCKMRPLVRIDLLQKLSCCSLPERNEKRNTSMGGPSPGLRCIVHPHAAPVVHQFQSSRLDSISNKLSIYFRCELSYPYSSCLTWTSSELDIRNATDVRKYPEIPAFLFLTLSCVFWLSFARVGAVSPTTWPFGPW